MFGISGFELVIIIAFALLIFGPDKLPQMARTAGRFINQFKRFQEEMEGVLKAEMYGAERRQKVAEVTKSAKTSGETVVEAIAEDYDDDEEEEEEV